MCRVKNKKQLLLKVRLLRYSVYIIFLRLLLHLTNTLPPVNDAFRNNYWYLVICLYYLQIVILRMASVQ